MVDPTEDNFIKDTNICAGWKNRLRTWKAFLEIQDWKKVE